MRERVPGKTLGDYVTIAFSPLLIMALVGSLVFFLLEVLYGGRYSARLQWTLFWFVFAMVLIARIAIEQADGRAGMYGLGLGAAVFLSLQAFIEYPPDAPIASFRWAINLGLMALIWWCAHRLVWDCTYIDDKVDDSGAGLLDAAGLQAETDDDGDEEETVQEDGKAGKKSKKQPRGFSGWLDRYRLYRERRDKKPHTAGVWVVYFSLAALPLFGLGQALIPATDGDRRRYVFWLMVIYVGSGLGLLGTTSYLGLRRYLRQRKLAVPVSLTAAWLTMGTALIASMLLIGALLPRPFGEYQLIQIKPFGSPERDASKYAVKGDGAGKGDGRASSDPKARDAKAKDGSGTQRSDKSSSTAKGDKSGGSSKGSKGGGSQKGNKGGGKSGKSDSPDDKNRDDSKQDANDKSEQSRSDEEAKDKERDSRNGPNSKTDRRGNKAEGKRGKQTDQKDQEKQDQQDKSSSEKQSPPSFQFLQKLSWLGTLLKWVVFGLIALVVVFFLLRSGLRWLANFTMWAQNLLNALSAWWNGLFGGSGRRADGGEQEEPQEEIRRPRPFASYSNPFRDGTAGQSSPEEVARYTFAAFEAWANDHDLGRSQQETPLEFFERVARQSPELAADGKRMLACYVRVAYARSRLTPAALPVLEKFWNRLEGADAPELAEKGAWEDENGS
jgi:hypothetical protein